eukprot:2455453-Alexandrium_andersonii.AAC.1
MGSGGERWDMHCRFGAPRYSYLPPRAPWWPPRSGPPCPVLAGLPRRSLPRGWTRLCSKVCLLYTSPSPRD